MHLTFPINQFILDYEDYFEAKLDIARTKSATESVAYTPVK